MLLTLRCTQCIIVLRTNSNRISALEALGIANRKVNYKTEQEDAG